MRDVAGEDDHQNLELQDTIRELETANEEQQAVNEEASNGWGICWAMLSMSGRSGIPSRT